MGAPYRILFVSPHPRGCVGSQRFRFEQYLDFLADNGFETTFSPILAPDDYATVYGPGGVARKTVIFGRGLLLRLYQAVTPMSYDLVFVQREAIQLGTVVFERAMARRQVKLVYDFDDAIWLPETSEANRAMEWVKRPQKVRRIMALSDLVFAGNQYLADYARRLTSNVEVVPTTIDTDRHVRHPVARNGGPVCIGWTGSPTTVKHFELALPALRRVKERFGERVRFKLIGDPSYRRPELGLEVLPWRAETEIEDLSDIDIGLMPLPDDEWSKGKCGLKALQYMALEMAAVMSPVGANREIVRDGVNGFMASSADEWVERLSELIESAALRERLGRAARRTVVERYSVASQQGRYLQYLSELVGER